MGNVTFYTHPTGRFAGQAVTSFKLDASLPKFDEIVQDLSEVRPDITEKVPQNQRGAVDPANRLYPATAGKKRRFLKR
jgi:hypothetical protein